MDSPIFYISHLIPETDIFLSPVPLHFRQVLFLPTVLTVPMLSLTSSRSCSLHRFCQRPLLFHISQIRSRYALRSYQIYPVTYLPAIYQSLLFRSQCPLFPNPIFVSSATKNLPLICIVRFRSSFFSPSNRFHKNNSKHSIISWTPLVRLL